jgi:homoserine kinase
MAEVSKVVRVRVPATSANLGPGFDALGVALRLYNTVEISVAQRAEVVVAGEGAEQLPANEANPIYSAAQEVARLAGGRDVRFVVRCSNGIPVARGLGSSAAARVAGIVGANSLLGEPLDVRGIANLACVLEGHPDNVVAAITGAFAVVAGGPQGLRWTRVTPPTLPGVVLTIPDLPIDTAQARACVPRTAALEDAVFNVSRTALLVAALSAGRFDLLGEAMEDRLHQPYRAPLVPGLNDVLRAARHAGAFGAALSGAGSAVIAFAPEGARRAVAQAMVSAFARHGVQADAVFTEIDCEGTVVEADGGSRPLIPDH